MKTPDGYEIIIGLEIHIRLLTKSKLFVADENQFGASANANVSFITTGHPGVLPVINKEAVKMAAKMGIATNCTVQQYNYFDRKHYCYPDLPKGFQTTQDNQPICINGYLIIDGKKININRIHMEEDAGKSIHDLHPEKSMIDLNRAGTPLLELVSEPDIRSADEAADFFNLIRQTAMYINICDGNMQEGSMRCDANISIRKKGDEHFNNRVEVKNLNSVRFLKRAIEFEVKRQHTLMENGEETEQETRGYDPVKDITIMQRDKEMAHDYRYFPEPDLGPVIITDTLMNEIRSEISILPQQLEALLKKEYKLSDYDAQLITTEKPIADYYLSMLETVKSPKRAANWLNTNVREWLNDNQAGIESFPIEPGRLAELVNLIEDNSLSHHIADRQIFPEMLKNQNAELSLLIKALNLQEESSDEELKSIMEALITQFPDKFEAYQKGRKGLLGFFVGQVMRKLPESDPKQVNTYIQKYLNKEIK